MEGFLKQTYLFSVFRMMSEDGGGGRSKVFMRVKEQWIHSGLVFVGAELGR